MLQEHFRFSDSYKEGMVYKERIDELYKKGLDMVRDGTLYGFKVNLSNPKEVIAALFLLAEDYNRFHERF